MFDSLLSIIKSFGAFLLSISIAIGLYSIAPEEEQVFPNTEENISTEKTTTAEENPEEKPIATPLPSKEVDETPENKTTTSPNFPSVTEILSTLSITTQPTSIVNQNVRGALVNILCTTKSSGILKPITASGVIIDPRGVILTNAHAAQYMLLKDFQTKDFVECIIRTGAPAYPKYKAELLFISPEWIEKNYKNITESNPLGTGENDFALLLITDAVGTNELPGSFPYLKIETEDKAIEAFRSVSHLIAGYPAGFLGGITIIKELYPVTTTATIKELFTFKETTIDLISLGGTIVSQKGSSGGAVVNQHTEKLVGIIVTTSDGETTAERDLRAVTTTHINRSLVNSVGLTLQEFLSGNLKTKSETFLREKAPDLANTLIKAITE